MSTLIRRVSRFSLRQIAALALITVMLSLFPNTRNAVAQQLVQKIIPQSISFEEKGALDGVTVDGCEFSSTGWEASDGVVVFLEIYYCKSPASARAAWSRLTSDLTKIFEKKILTERGKKAGERIVASSSKDETKHPEIILWTDGDEIYKVESKSFEHALVFEKKFPNI